RPGILSQDTQRAGVPASCNPACKRSALARTEHRNLCGFGYLTLESPRLLPHIGAAARKHDFAGDGGVTSISRWENRQFRAFAVRNEINLTGGCGQAPRASFCVLKV